MRNLAFGVHANGPTGGFGGPPYGTTKRCTGWAKMPSWAFGTHADGSTETVGGAPYGATKRCTGWLKMPIGCVGRVRTVPLGISVELPLRPRNVVLGS
eukprot:7531530-Pyramimonas_sp.AAC.1